jgi:hypothetical protein
MAKYKWGRGVGEDTASKMAVGRIIGYNKVLNPFKRQYKVRISVNDRTVIAVVDDNHLAFIRKKYWTGGRLAVGYYGGKWHIGVPKDMTDEKPADINPPEVKPDEVKPTDTKPQEVKPKDAKTKEVKPEEVKPSGIKPAAVSNDAVDLLEKELGELNIKELIGPPDKSIDSISGIPSKLITLEDNLLQDIDKFSGYLKWVEQYTRENADDILDRIQLSHLSTGKLDKLRLSDIAAVDNKKKDGASEDLVEVLDYIISQNDEIILSQQEIIRLLSNLPPSYKD